LETVSTIKEALGVSFEKLEGCVSAFCPDVAFSSLTSSSVCFSTFTGMETGQC